MIRKLKTNAENKSKTIYFYLSDDELGILDYDAKAVNLSRSEYVRFKIRTAIMLPPLNINYKKFAKITVDLLDKIIAIDELTECSKIVNIPLLRQTLSEINTFAADLRKTILTEKENQKCVNETTE